MNDKCCGCHHLHPWAFGFAAAIISAIFVFVIAIINAGGATYGAGFVTFMSTFYLGYGATFGGAIAGAIWAFFYTGIGYLIFAWLYNRFARCCKKEESKESAE